MSDPFVHLHVASGYSLRYGATHPHELVERAAEHGMQALALTDRDGVYGTVKFVTACRAAGIRAVLGVDLAVAPVICPARSPSAAHSADRVGSTPGGSARRSPARGGAFVEPDYPRVTLIARDVHGWASLCRLVTATHLAGERGKPVCTLDLIAEHAGALFVLLGPASELGRAIAARRLGQARAHLDRWRDAAGSGLLIEIVNHQGRDELVSAARLLGFAAEQGVPAVLTNAVRYADPTDAAVADVLDAARQLVVLDRRHIRTTTTHAYLKSGKEMAEVAEEIARHSGIGDRGGRDLLMRTRRVADECVIAPGAGGLGLGELHFPEFELTDAANTTTASALLRERCRAGFGRRGVIESSAAWRRLDDELSVIDQLGYPSYFLTVAEIVELIKSMRIRCAARGSGAGSFVNYLLGISDVDPLRYGLLMERFLSPLRQQLPDIDIDVESARRTEVYEEILDRFGGERCTCVSMMDTYRARHAVRDVGAALGLPPDEIDAVAKAFPHIRANQLRAALRDLPELRASRLAADRHFDLLFRLAERLDGLPRHIAVHPCGVLLSDATLLDRTPLEASWFGFPMSQFDKDDVEALGLLKLDVLGVRMQSAIAHALDEIRRVDGAEIDIDEIARDDEATFALIQSTKTLGCFQIESPGQRELVGKFAPETFNDIIIDISLFRPGPVKSDMVTPFLMARQGWQEINYLHEDLEPVLDETGGVVVFHEQVLQIIHVLTRCSLAEADEARRALGDPAGQPEVRAWFIPAALGNGYDVDTVLRVWEVLKAFASFGFCKAHAAAFAVPTYQSAWLKAHYPAAFMAGVLTHDPGMYPKRLILDDARQFGIAVLPLDVNRSDASYRVERVGIYDEPPPVILDQAAPRARPDDLRLPDGRAYGIRLALADVKGITDAEIASIVAGRPFATLSDFWQRAAVSRPVAERLVLAGAFDELYGIGGALPIRRRGQLTRRDLLLQLAQLHAWTKSARPLANPVRPAALPASSRELAASAETRLASPSHGQPTGIRAATARQSQAPAAAPNAHSLAVQLTFDLAEATGEVENSGLPELTRAERVRAELEILGLDASEHVMAVYEPFLAALGVTRARDLLRCRSRQEVLTAGVKVATQTPPVRSGKRVVFVTLDDATGPVDATFFEDAQVGYASTLFHSWLLVIRGLVRRTGPRGVSMQATGCWELPVLRDAWEAGGLPAVHAAMDAPGLISDAAVHGAAESRSTRPVMVAPPVGHPPLIYASGFRLSPYSDIKPAGQPAARSPRKLWHASPGSSGR